MCWFSLRYFIPDFRKLYIEGIPARWIWIVRQHSMVFNCGVYLDAPAGWDAFLLSPPPPLPSLHPPELYFRLARWRHAVGFTAVVLPPPALWTMPHRDRQGLIAQGISSHHRSLRDWFSISPLFLRTPHKLQFGQPRCHTGRRFVRLVLKNCVFRSLPEMTGQNL